MLEIQIFKRSMAGPVSDAVSLKSSCGYPYQFYLTNRVTDSFGSYIVTSFNDRHTSEDPRIAIVPLNINCQGNLQMRLLHKNEHTDGGQSQAQQNCI